MPQAAIATGTEWSMLECNRCRLLEHLDVINDRHTTSRTGGKNPLLNRQSMCLPGCDYTHNEAYFIILCTHGRRSLFGHIINGEIALNDYGYIVQEE